MNLYTLDEVCEFQSGLWTGKKGPYKVVKVLRNTNFTKDNKLNLENIAEIKVEVKQLEKRILEKGDILIEKSGGGPNQPVGRVVFIDKRAVDYSFSNFTSRIRVTSDDLNPNYLYWFLNYIYLSGTTENLQRRSTGIRNLQLKEYKQLVIKVPSLQEQEKIVERLEKIFKNIQNNLDKLIYLNTLITTKLEKSIFISECEKVDTKKLKVKEFSNIQGGGTPKTSVKEYWGGEIDFYTPKELSQYSDVEIAGSSKKVTKLGLSKGAGKLLPVDTILFSSRAPIGYVAILKKEGSTNQGFQSFILKNKNDKYFFYFLLRNNKEYIESFAPGATFKDISKSRIEEIEFSIPSFKQQIEIGKKMLKVKNNIEKKSKLYKSNYEELLKLRKSFLSKEFSYE